MTQTTTIMPEGRQRYFNNDGTPCAGGKLYTYAAGTTTPKATYADAAGTIANANPVPLDAHGEAVIFWAGAYKVDLKQADGQQVTGYPVDQLKTDPAGVWALLSSLAASGASALLGWLQAGAKAAPRTVQDKLRESVSVFDFGAKGDGGTDDLAAFQAAVDALPPAGGRILVPDAAYMLSAAPTWGTKSIYWDIRPGATFTGPGTGQNKFPSMKTNGGQIAAGPWIQSQSRVPYTYSTPFAGGVAAMQVEMLQPADVVGQSVALYLGASGSNANPNANVWAGNFLIRVESGAGGTYQGIELDVDVMSDAALVKGLSINGIGTANPDVGIELIRSDATRWKVGIDIMNALTGIQVRNTAGLTMGVTVGEPTAQTSAAIVAKQLVNGGDGVVLQRITDTAPTGSAIRLADLANTKNLFNIDVNGIATFQSMILANGAVSGSPGQFSLGNTIAAAATAGTAGALPAAPAGYWTILYGTTAVKIPYYNN